MATDQRTYRVRSLAPMPTDFHDVTGTDEIDAIQSFHMNVLRARGSLCVTPDPTRAHGVYFALVQIDGQEPMISKYEHQWIGRYGGVRGPSLREQLAAVVAMTGWDGKPEELLEDFDGNETWEEASALAERRRALA